MDKPEKAPDLKDYTGLDLIEFYVVPHYKNWELGKAAEKIIQKYATTLDLKIITDNQAILIENDTWKLLNR